MQAIYNKLTESRNVDIAIWIMTICSLIDTLSTLIDRMKF